MEHLVGTCHFESLKIFVTADSVVIVLQMHVARVVGYPEVFEPWTLAQYVLHPVLCSERDKRVVRPPDAFE